MPAEHTVTITATKYPYLSIYYERDYKFYGKKIVVVIPYWEAAISGDETIIIKREGVKVSEGRIKLIEPYEGVGKGVGMMVTGFTNELDNKDEPSAARNYLADPNTVIIADNLNSRLSAGTIDAYGSDIAMEVGTTDEAKFDKQQVIAECCFITGHEIYVSPASAVDVKAACGTDLSATVIFKHGELLREWVMPHRVDMLNVYDKVIVLGALEDIYMAYGSAGSGAKVFTVQRKNLIDNDTCEKAAAAIHEDSQNSTIKGAFKCTNTYTGQAFDVYDTVKVIDARFGIDASYRIYRIECRVDKDGGEDMTIFYTNLNNLTSNGPLLLEIGKTMLKAGQRIMRDVSRASLNVVNLDSLDGSTGNVDLGGSGIEGDLDDVDDGSSYGKVVIDGLTSGQIKAAGCITAFGAKGAAAEMQSAGDDEWSESDDDWTTHWTSPLYPAIDGVVYIITNYQIDLKRGGSVGFAWGKIQYNLNGAGWVDFGTYRTTPNESWITLEENPSDVATGVNETLQMRLQLYSTIDGGASICYGRRPIIMMYAKLYRRDL